MTGLKDKDPTWKLLMKITSMIPKGITFIVFLWWESTPLPSLDATFQS